MKFIINKNTLVENLQKVLGPATTKQNSPILNSVLIVTKEGKIEFTTTDLDITTISLQKANIEKSGQAAIPIRRFFSLVKELPPQDVEIEKIKNTLLIKCEKIEFKMNTLDHEEFPQIKQEKKGVSLIKIDPQELEEMVDLTAFCVGYEDANYVLSGILFEIVNNKINLVSTDGKRLAFAQKTLPPTQPEIKAKISFILPLKAVIELHKLLKERDEEVYLYVKENRVGIEFKNTQFIARPIEGEFPNYSQYIPESGKNKLVIDRRKLLFALKRAGTLSVTDYQGVKVELKKEDSVIFSKNTPQLGEIKEVVDAQYDGASMDIGFNTNYLTDVLKKIEDESVCIDFSGPDKPAVLRKQGYVYLLLPIKI